jgi:hypothetical protein
LFLRKTLNITFVSPKNKGDVVILKETGFLREPLKITFVSAKNKSDGATD